MTLHIWARFPLHNYFWNLCLHTTNSRHLCLTWSTKRTSTESDPDHFFMFVTLLPWFLLWENNPESFLEPAFKLFLFFWYLIVIVLLITLMYLFLCFLLFIHQVEQELINYPNLVCYYFILLLILLSATDKCKWMIL